MRAKLFVSMVSFYRFKSSYMFFTSTGRSFFIITHRRIFAHRLTSIEPRDYRVVFVIQKKACNHCGYRLFYWVQGADLNHRPPGYEPDELPDCSTLRYMKLVPETGIEPVREINPTGF